jgi:hypothetical protein
MGERIGPVGREKSAEKSEAGRREMRVGAPGDGMCQGRVHLKIVMSEKNLGQSQPSVSVCIMNRCDNNHG